MIRHLKLWALFKGSLWSILLGSLFVVVIDFVDKPGSEPNHIESLIAGGFLFGICVLVSTVSLGVAVPFIIAPAYLAYPRFISKLGATLLGVFCGPIFLATAYMVIKQHLIRADEIIAIFYPAAIYGALLGGFAGGEKKQKSVADS